MLVRITAENGKVARFLRVCKKLDSTAVYELESNSIKMKLRYLLELDTLAKNLKSELVISDVAAGKGEPVLSIKVKKESTANVK